MGIKRFKPTTPGVRHAALPDFAELTKGKPEKSLLRPIKRTGGRNSLGRLTMRHRGGGHKRMYRLIDFKRQRFDVAADVIAIEYDPNRSARIALLRYPDGEKAYIIAPLEIKVGQKIVSIQKGEPDIRPGNCMPIRMVPLGTAVHNIELKVGRGGQIVRSAGSSAQIMAKEGDYAHVRLPSGEVRMISLDCRCTIGQIGNVENETVSIGKAGRTRWLGRRSRVRGVAMNPVDHPHGGGEGKSPQGNPHPVSPWGQLSKGLKTRTRKKYSNVFILKRRNNKKGQS
ncbi:MAG: 50S ribosomal protein L2 [Omnitrophica WOR_2 bacterium GWA2_47_8]|nr:MAG: 50S ribosomal protein L2 [Omnitrophica WOR_2 bacterium GWA2_47_8]